jgi:hypothetical protein
MGGTSEDDSGDLFAFIAKDGPEKERILTLPGEKPVTKKTWKFIARNMLQVSPGKNKEMVYVAGEKKWQVFVGEKEWPPCDTLGRLMSSPSGQTWASTAKRDGKLVMMVNGVPSKAYAEIQHGDSLFPAGDERVVFAVSLLDESKTPAHMVVDGKQGKAYAQVTGDSVVFSADKKSMAYIAGDGSKNFVVLNGMEGPAFDQVADLRFSPAGSVLAYRARRGLEHFVLVDGKSMGPYGEVEARFLPVCQCRPTSGGSCPRASKRSLCRLAVSSAGSFLRSGWVMAANCSSRKMAVSSISQKVDPCCIGW